MSADPSAPRPMSTEPRPMTIGQLAKAVDKTPRAVRLYEEMGLLTPAGRSSGGFRLYGEDALERLRWIIRLNDVGLPLNEIQTMLSEIGCARRGGEAMDGLRARYTARLEELEAQIAQLQGLRDALADGLEYLKRCESCDLGPLPECCSGCVEEVGDVPTMVSGLLAQKPVDRIDPCRLVGHGRKGEER